MSSAAPAFVYHPDHDDEEDVYSPNDSLGGSFVVYPKSEYLREDGDVSISDVDPVLTPLVDEYDLDPIMENTFRVPEDMSVDQMFAILADHPEFERITPCPVCPLDQPCGY